MGWSVMCEPTVFWNTGIKTFWRVLDRGNFWLSRKLGTVMEHCLTLFYSDSGKIWKSSHGPSHIEALFNSHICQRQSILPQPSTKPKDVQTFPSVWVDFIFPMKSTGELDFPKEWTRPIPTDRTHLQENIPAESSPVNFLQNSRTPNEP
jgi:hypothetical protein